MATVEKPPTRVRNVAEASRRVLDPLQRLRGYIRLYVGLEAAAIVLIYILACSWLSLLFDYGAFKLPWGLSIDWVQELPRWLRATLLLGFFYGVLLIVAATAINRLMQRFRDSALAIELERRFPRILGDRLITAVELANRKKVVEQGYSQAMVDETIVEAAQRVEKLPIKEVFRWGRLWFMGAMVVVLSVVMYFVVAAGYATTNYFVSRQSVATSFGDYNEILSTWFERNVLLENTIWPRKSYLVVLSPENPDISVGRDVTPPTLRVLAWEYVVADQHAKNREGWRLLTWNDLVTKKELLGNSPAAVAPEDWKNVRDANVGLTVDEVKLYFNKFDVRKGENPTTEDDQTVYTLADGQQVPFKWATPGKADEGGPQGWRPLTWKELTGDKLQMTNAVPPLPSGWAPPLTPSIGYTIDEVEEANKANPNPDINNVLAQLERLNDMRKTLDHLDTRLADSSMRRKVRKLIVPAKVTVTIRGREATFTMDLDKNADNEFTGEFNKEKLKEKNLKDTWAFKYYATGEDYSTATRKLTIVPPPTLQELFREDEQPAYLFYRYGNPSNATAADIKGKRQPLQRRTVSVTGGDVVVDCPAGTNVTLIGTSDKDLASVELVPNESGDPAPPVTLDKPREFHVALSNVRQKRDYVLKMIDTSGVSGKRPIHITVKRDEEPSVDVDVADWVRRNKSELMVTARARIPFAGNIKDDNGLLRINYAFTVAKLESTAVLDVKAINAATNVLGQMLPGTSGPLQGALYLERALDDIEKTKAGAGGPEGKEVKYFPGKNESISRFEQELKDVVAHPGEFLPRSEIEKNLAERKAAGFRTLFSDLKKFEPDPMTYELAPDPFRGDFNVAEAMKAHLTAGSVQPRFRMTLWVEATDTDLDSTRAVDGQDGPKTASSKVRYQIVIVPEDELQAEIAKDESEMATTMSGALEKLKEVQRKLSGEIRGDLAKKRDAVKPEDRLAPENLGPLAIRTAALEEAIGQSQASAKEVLMKYQALFKELKGNDIQGNKIKTVLEEIIEPLDNLDRTKFIDVREKMQALHSDLTSKDKFEDLVVRAQMDAQAADEQLQKVIEILEMVKGKMEKEIELNKLVQRLRDELQRLQRSKEVIEIIRLWKLKKLDEGS